MAILPNLTAELEAANARIAQMEAALALANKPKAITMKVSEKGAISIYGMGRFPITLYRGQAERLIKAVPQLEAFIAANAALLSVKP